MKALCESLKPVIFLKTIIISIGHSSFHKIPVRIKPGGFKNIQMHYGRPQYLTCLNLHKALQYIDSLPSGQRQFFSPYTGQRAEIVLSLCSCKICLSSIRIRIGDNEITDDLL
jgi:hypothetical protein